jgi:FkbM family methyltransferase
MSFLSEQFHVSSFQTTIDIGANIGNHSLYFSKKSKVVYAYEPHPETYELLKFNTRNQDSIYTYNFALSNQNQILTLKNSSQNIGGASVSIANNTKLKNLSFDKEFHINLAMLDNQAELFKRDISLIKIDVEGHEWEVIDGSKKLISLKKPIILFEKNSDIDFSKVKKIEKLLKSKDYIFYSVNRNFEISHGSKFKIISLILRAIFGEKYIIRETSNLSIDPRPLVIAAPNKLKDSS